MCLGVPMKIETIEDGVARCQAKGIFREVNLMLMEGTALVPGDFVMVHVGYAIQKIGQADARTSWELHDEMARGSHA
ncbi:HypC/HybG/HupF family hydrogenase formation chaperone [Vreelandella rituensis]|uniref:HypC/HybG/HupF family hydrogenase formation chaperone n=1 Tax=Vreelandella rituensis TaxID=2282306 RepID=A0A368TP47_9GAMM|nr:HypC/HybG/HupF family hydrogenase formation chaperone [Halomonas rituensis]RCV86007.1 HypC/HybG/HupF family hydrogenase formation chaperone [Halomonas rituensis]